MFCWARVEGEIVACSLFSPAVCIGDPLSAARSDTNDLRRAQYAPVCQTSLWLSLAVTAVSAGSLRRFARTQNLNFCASLGGE